MQSSEAQTDEVTVDVENVGGIDSTSVTLGAGVSVLTGRNATNRTSFLRALMGALGSDGAALKADADSGRVDLTIGEATYTRTFERRNGSVITGGDPYLDDPDVADRFAFLLESNGARQAVRTGDDLRAVLMEPVDTTAIEREIDRLRRERDDIDRRLDELDEQERRLPDLQAERERLLDELETAKAELAAKREEIDDADISPEGSDPVTDALTDLKALRDELEDVRFRLEAERESRDALDAEREELQSQLDDLGTPEGDAGEIAATLDALREERRSVDSLVSQLGSVISFNRERLTGADDPVAAALSEESDDVTDKLLGTDEVTCWTCGEPVERDQVEETVDRLTTIRDDQLSRRRDLDNRIESLEDDREALEQTRTERERLERELERTDAELDERSATIDRLTSERDRLTDRIEEREQAVADLESDAYEGLLSLHREANELEFEVDRLSEELDAVESDIAELEASVAEREELQTTRGELTQSLSELRTRIVDLEREAVDAFNDHMERVLEILGYGNLARVWIERIERAGSGPLDTDSRFDLHVVRETDDGAAYEDTIAHLSESEREVVGLMFALAGYLVHEVYEEVPFMVLDSLEAIDSNRIAGLVDYVADYAPYLVVALLPEDAEALDDRHRRVTEI